MRNGVSRPVFVLSTLVAILAGVASAGGIFVSGLYRDNAFVNSTWLGSDLVTLFVAVPLLVVALLLATRGSDRAYLVLLGVVDSILYSYGFYLFGTAFNPFFMIYAAVVSLAIWALIYGLTNLDAIKLSRRFVSNTPVKTISGYMLFVGLGLASVYIAQWLGFLTSGQVPDIVTKTGHPTNVVYALDLTLVIPVFIVGALWLWQRKPWGFVVAAIMNVKGAVYMLGLSASTLTAYRAGTVESPAEIVLWGSIGIGCLVAAVTLLACLKSATSSNLSPVDGGDL